MSARERPQMGPHDALSTPSWLMRDLSKYFRVRFVLDVCALDTNAKAPHWISPDDDAFEVDWHARFARAAGALDPPASGVLDAAWQNHPYGRGHARAGSPARATSDSPSLS